MVRTTKASRQKEKVLNAISKIPEVTEDRYGNFKLSDTERYHPKKTALNKQVKRNNWVNIWTAYYKDIEITDEGELNVLKVIR